LVPSFRGKVSKKTLRAEIRSLVDLAVHDKDQWVSLIARALGGLKERFDLGQLQKDVPAVAGALASIRNKIQAEGTPDSFRPLEETYLSPRLLCAAQAPAPDAGDAHAHFTLRARREPKRRLPTTSSHHKGLSHVSSNPDLSVRAAVGNAARRPSPSASMFAPPSRKPTASFLLNTAPPRRPSVTGGVAAKSHLSRGRESGHSGGTKTMMIDVSEAAQLGTVKGEDLRVEAAQKEKEEAQKERERLVVERERLVVERDVKRKREQEEKQIRIRKMMEEREVKKKQEAERKRARDDENARRKCELAVKRARLEPPRGEGTATPSPKEGDVHGC